jgi:hypothetical protein
MPLPLTGVGRPKLMRALVPAAKFAATMDAVRSNMQLSDQITLFLERPGGGRVDGASDGRSAGEQQQQQQEEQTEQDASVFDSSLFDE